jgi:predicted NAD/FAD-dependent oxidoreductase
MQYAQKPQRIAVIGAGIAGVACAASLAQAGEEVSLFDKSRGVGGRMATRRTAWTDDQGRPHTACFDHGAPWFSARHPRFRAALLRAERAGVVQSWQPQVHAAWPAPRKRPSFVATPNMPALCRHFLGDLPLHTGHAVQRLQRDSAGWQLALEGGSIAGPFDQVMLALPPAQAAVLLAGHQDTWADELVAMRMHPCWTLMAVTNDVDWPWDAADIDHGPLARVLRNDRKPGRQPQMGLASWVAHATPAWSAAHLEANPVELAQTLGTALAALLPAGPLRWHHRAAHRWRYAAPAEGPQDRRECLFDGDIGLGVCGDFFGAGEVEAAWRSGDELADTVSAWLEQDEPVAEPA